MRQVDHLVELSASDLFAFLGCRHRTGLDLAVARGELAKPEWIDPFALVLRERGRRHERQYVDALRAGGCRVLDLTGVAAAAARTVEGMHGGLDVIVQASLRDGRWQGYPDILRRVDTPSDLGAWSYEVYDTKLALETRGGTVLQLCAYSDLVARIQGRLPDRFHVVTPDPVMPVHTYRVEDFTAYYRMVRAELETAVESGVATLLAHYPEPVEHCDLCCWLERCDARRRNDDHVSFIAGIGRVHRTELESHGIATLAATAAMAVPLTFVPSRGSAAVYARIREQARVQVEQRTTGRPVHELLLPIEAGQGLARLPAPSEGDVFLDLEGARFAREGGREYLFGVWRRAAERAVQPPLVSGGQGLLPLDATAEGAYRSWWAHDDAEERAAFEGVLDLIMAAWDSHPDMHVYHFGHYEPSTLKRLMGRYATRAEELDRLLRAERFVDLHAVVRRALRAGVESYSIKRLEPFYGFSREVPLAAASVQLHAIELALEARAPDIITDAVRTAVEAYNRDDCRSTLALADWLEGVRAAQMALGVDIPRPIAKEDEAPPKVSALEDRVDVLRAALLDQVPLDPAGRSTDQQTRWLLAYLLDWHRREDKVAWWEYYRLRDLPEEDLVDEPDAIAGLTFVTRVRDVIGAKTRRPTGSVIDRYTYPVQEMEIRDGDSLKLTDGTAWGEVEDIDRVNRTIDVQKGRKHAPIHPSAVFEHRYFSPDVMQESLLRIAGAILDAGCGRSCGMDLLFRRPPRLASGAFGERPGESTLDFSIRCGLELDAGALAIQGPPGSGKTLTGARMIGALVNAGKRVGVTAVSHKVIRNLLDAVRREARGLGAAVRCGHKTKPRSDDPADVAIFEDNADALQALKAGGVNVLGATAWLWAREAAAGAVDVLFVDEAGQMSLANVLAASQGARNLVLLGDPQQLEQPQRGSHPDGVDVSALDHVIGAGGSRMQTMPADRGIFLPVTWRLAPAICRFTSEAFYEGRLASKPGLERQTLAGTGLFDGAGLWFVPIEHTGNQNWSAEEIDAVARIVDTLTGRAGRRDAPHWVDERGVSAAIQSSDILVVAPYNAQVNRLQERLDSTGVRVGTVDRFQGQEAAVVIYSMASSSPDAAPRGMEFLYSLNRLNVATSRARCAAILVASPRLFEPECRTPGQMQLANALCRFKELATAVRVSDVGTTGS